MGILKKNESQIDKKILEQNLADTALSLLVNKQEIVMEDINNIKIEFGYLLMIENHGLEALFKVSKDINVYYFAAQKDNLTLLNFNEQQYKETVAYMLKQHKSDQTDEGQSNVNSKEKILRREINNKFIKKQKLHATKIYHVLKIVVKCL